MAKGFQKSVQISHSKLLGIMLKAKKDSFENSMKVFSPGVAMIQETKLYRKGTMCFNNYSCFEKVRGQSVGCGLMTLVHNSLNPVLIPTKNVSKTSLNVLVVEANINELKTRFINAYGVQETASTEEKLEFYSVLEEEISQTLASDRMVCLELDANAKIGNQIIRNDPHEISANGKLLLSIVERNN